MDNGVGGGVRHDEDRKGLATRVAERSTVKPVGLYTNSHWSRHPSALHTGCTKGFSDVKNYEENAYKMTNSLKVFYALKIVENSKFSCNFLVSAFHKLRKF